MFCILEIYVGICGNALKLIKSYFSSRTQRVQIDNVLSDFANIICGVPQRSVLGPLKLCLYLLPLSAILRYHNIGYHVHADDTQLYVLFKCKQPLEAISKLKSCLEYIRRWAVSDWDKRAWEGTIRWGPILNNIELWGPCWTLVMH